MYVSFIPMLRDPGRKLSLEMCLGIVLKAVIAQCPKAEPGEREPLMVPGSVLEFIPWKSRCSPFPNNRPSSKLRCSHKHFFPSHIETGKKKIFIVRKALELSQVSNTMSILL